MQIKLRGLPEGMIGKSEIEVESVQDAIEQYPIMELYAEELNEVSGGNCVQSTTVSSFAACDG
ncbi:MAG: hypothetical protein ACQZ2J_26550 [Pseudomonas piscis]|uniref:hypothetical protein n=1 Tax=Pseudomonas piscis TaxID=2614538 RepID=UPI003D27A078